MSLNLSDNKQNKNVLAFEEINFFTNYAKETTLKNAKSPQMLVLILDNFIENHTAKFHNYWFITNSEHRKIVHFLRSQSLISAKRI